MRKDYIIKDARRILAEQIRDNGRNTMNENPITNATGCLRLFQKIMMDTVPSINWTVRMAWAL
jgi:hypothetical protein